MKWPARLILAVETNSHSEPISSNLFPQHRLIIGDASSAATINFKGDIPFSRNRAKVLEMEGRNDKVIGCNQIQLLGKEALIYLTSP